MASSTIPVGRTSVGREVALHVGHPLASWVKWVLLHPRLEIIRRNKRKIIIAILVTPKLFQKLRQKLKDLSALPPADFRGTWTQIVGGDIGTTIATQTGRTVTMTNATQFWNPAVMVVKGSKFDIVQPDFLKGLGGTLVDGNRIEFNHGVVWQRQKNGDIIKEAAAVQANAGPISRGPKTVESASLFELVRGHEGNIGYQELIACASLAFAGSFVMSKKAVVLGQLLARQYEIGLSREWLQYAISYPFMCLLNVVFVDGCGFMQSRIALKWRRNLTSRLHDLYFSHMRYYRILNESDGKLPDPDARTCSDVKELVDRLSFIAVKLITASVYGCYFARTVTRNRHWSWALVGPAFMACGAYSIISFESTRRFTVMGGLQESEGRFHQLLTRVQLHAERVAMLQGESYEANLLNRNVDKTHEMLQSCADLSVVRDTMESACFGTGANLNELVANIVASCMTANGVSAILATRGLTAPLDSTAPSNWISNIFGTIFLEEMHNFFNANIGWGALLEATVAYQGYVKHIEKRVKELYLHLLKLDAPQDNATFGLQANVFSDCGAVIRFDDVTIQTPTASILLQGLTFEVVEGRPLLICGHNGAGKSSIIRSLCNLWPIPKGRIARPGGAVQAEENQQLHDELYYLPQKPCNVLGSLSDQLTYPLRPPGGLPEDELRRWLSYVDLEYLVDRKVAASGLSRVSGATDNTDIDWEVLLSMGEQQALSIARLLYHHPRFAILDECTSAVGKGLERRLFEAAKILGITCITITHRPALKEHHGRLLQLTGEHEKDGKGWSISELPGGYETTPQVKRCSSIIEVHQRMRDLLKSRREGSANARSDDQADLATQREFAERRSTAYKEVGNDASVIVPRDAVLKRWPRRLARLWAIIRLAFQTREQQWSACKRLSIMCVFGGLKVKTYWDYWRALAGLIQGGLSGDFNLILANAVCGFAWTYLSSLCDEIFRHQASKLACDSWRATMDRMQQQVMDRGILLKVMNPNGFGGMSAVENPIMRLSEFRQIFESVLYQVKDVVLPLLEGIVMLPWMYRGIKNVTPGLLIANFFLFRGSQLLAPNFPQIQMQEAALESRFRVLHTRLRSIAEAVAFSGGGGAERRIIEPHFEAILQHKESSYHKEAVFNMMLTMFTDYRQLPLWTQRLATIVYVKKNSVIAADGSVSPDTVVSNFLFDRSIQFTQMATQKLVRLVEAAGKIDGQCIRCLELVLACHIASSETTESTQFSSLKAVAKDDQTTVSIRNLDLVTPRGECLAKDISFDLVAGTPIVITGPNASGKSLLGNVLLGLWPAAGRNASISIPGVVDGRPPLSFMMPAPQQVYLPLGNLISQLMYPQCFNMQGVPDFRCYVKGLPDGTSNEELLVYFSALGGVASHVVEEKPFRGLVFFPTMQAVFSAIVQPPKYEGSDLECDLAASDPRPTGLPELIKARKCLQAVGIDHILVRESKGWLEERAWEDTLSGGEKQRLCLARVLYHKPTFGLLDECTSMVAADSEEELYRQVFNKWNITPITLTQRLFMTDFYAQELSLGVQSADGWEMSDVAKS